MWLNLPPCSIFHVDWLVSLPNCEHGKVLTMLIYLNLRLNINLAENRKHDLTESYCTINTFEQ